MDNHFSSLSDRLQRSLSQRWPHDHLLGLWLAPVVAWLTLARFFSLPWEHAPLAAFVGHTALALLPGALLLQSFAPSPASEHPPLLSSAYRFWRAVGWIATPLAVAGAVLLGWRQHAWGTSLCLLGLTWVRWMPQLQERVIVTTEATWHLGLPISASRHEPQPEPVPLGDPIARGRWRYGVAVVLWLGWSALLWRASEGPQAWMASRWSAAAVVLWLLGGLVCLSLSRLPPRILPPRQGQFVWRERGRPQRWFWFLSVPCLGSAIAGNGITLASLFVGAPPAQAGRTAFFALLLLLVALTLLHDPSCVNAWLVRTPRALLVRRIGWIERFASNNRE